MVKELLPPNGYGELLQSLKDRIRNTQLRASVSVNREIVLLYWQIGREILSRQQVQGWGAKIIEQLGKDLQKSFPTLKGFSPRNLKYMRAFAEAYPEEQFVQQLAAQIPWFHNMCFVGQGKRPHRARILHSQDGRKRLESECFGDTNRNEFVFAARQSCHEF